MKEKSVSIRESLASALDAIESSDAPETETPELAAEPSVPAATESVSAEPAETSSSSEPDEVPSRDRDNHGRFAPKTVKPTAPAVAGAKVTTPKALKEVRPTAGLGTQAAPAPVPQASAPTALKAPQSWKPEAREKWNALPPEVQQDVMRREREVSVALQEATESRRFRQDFHQVLTPFEGMIRAEQAARGEQYNPIRTVHSLLQTAAALRHASPRDKGQLFARLINDFGGDLEHINAALQGAPAAQGQQPSAAHFDPQALARQVEQSVVTRFQQQREQQVRQRSAQELAEFAETAEFFNDVKPYMRSVLNAAAEGGVDDGLPTTLKEAYDLACRLHPRISKVLQQREAAEAANATAASTQRARAASSSVRSQPAGAPSAPQPASLRGQLEANLAKLSGR
jgi:hypothetical protein